MAIVKPQVLAPPSRTAVQVRGVTDDNWFGPLQPLPPVAPAGIGIRQWEYQVGQNLIYQPRGTEAIGFADMLYMAENCDLVRIVIEALKDQLVLLPWQIKVKEIPGESQASRGNRQKNHPAVERWTEFWRKPNWDMGYEDFLRMHLEDLFVLDAAPLLLQRTYGGDLGALHPIDGTTINRIIDDNGFTPPPPQAAYQQVLFGLPSRNISANDMLYRPRNRRTRKIYGYSPVEQILMTLNIALRRMQFQMAYYTEGNVPEALYTMPGNVPEDKVRKFQTWFDQELAGNLAKRRRVLFIPGDDKGVNRLHMTKEALIKDESDEYLARLVCFAFRISPKELIRVMNRASAAESQDSAEEMGVRSVALHLQMEFNEVMRLAGETEVVFGFAQKREADVLKQAQADKVYIDNGTKTRNEVREHLGEDPSDDPLASVLGITTPAGFFPLDYMPPEPASSGGGATPTAKKPKAKAPANN